MLAPHPLKAHLAAGRKAFGVWLSLGHPSANEALAAAGYDFVIHDDEHGVASLSQTLVQLQALDGTGIASVVRAPWNDPVYLKRALDLGAECLMIPMIETAEQAKLAVAACRYPPRGFRGSGPWRASAKGIDLDAYVRGADQRLMVICQIESAKAVANVDAIAAVEGVDVLFIGPNDLSGSVGRFREFEHRDVEGAIERAFAGIRRAGKPAGIVPYGKHTTSELFRAGFQMLAASSDLSLMHAGARAEVRAVRSEFG